MEPYIIFPIYLILVIFQLDLREQAFLTERYLLGGFSAVMTKSGHIPGMEIKNDVMWTEGT